MKKIEKNWINWLLSLSVIFIMACDDKEKVCDCDSELTPIESSINELITNIADVEKNMMSSIEKNAEIIDLLKITIDSLKPMIFEFDQQELDSFMLIANNNKSKLDSLQFIYDTIIKPVQSIHDNYIIDGTNQIDSLLKDFLEKLKN